jgi:hypothetical protein
MTIRGRQACVYQFVITFRPSRAAGRAIAEAVSRWSLNAAARVRSPVWSSGICGGQSGAGAGFLRDNILQLSKYLVDWKII